jgi:hypothetical protein
MLRSNRQNRHKRNTRYGATMVRTATTKQVAAALRVSPAAVRKYAREHRLPYDTTPGGHRRYDVDEAVAAVRDRTAGTTRSTEAEAELELVGPVPYVRVDPHDEVVATVVVDAVGSASVRVVDEAGEIEDWATETPVV